MFIGSINRYMRAVLEQAAHSWKGLPVYVACSGNFTVERILALATTWEDVARSHGGTIVCASSGAPRSMPPTCR
jgi:hypothetical protein